MKIKEYNQMMSYLTRPNTKTVVKNNKILDDVRKQKELEATQGLLGLIPNSSKIIERSESRMKQLKPKTYGGDDDL